MNLKAVAIGIALIANTAMAQTVSFVESEPNTVPKTVLLTSGSDFIVPLHKSLINQLPNTEFLIVVGNEVNAKEYDSVKGKNVTVLEYNNPLTSWAQDRSVRLHSNGTPLYTHSYSTHLAYGGASPFELGLSSFLSKNLPEKFAQVSLPLNTISVDRSTGEVYNSVLPKFFQGKYWNMIYGDGGDRIIYGDTMFVGGSTLAQIKKYTGLGVEALANVYGKKIVSIDSEIESERFDFHIDVFMTPVGNNKVMLANPNMYANTNAAWINKARFTKSIARHAKVKEQLIAAGFEVVDVPVLYVTTKYKNLKHNATFNWNNGVWNGMEFITASYTLDGANELIQEVQEEVKSIYQAHGVTIKYLEGGTAPAVNGGGVRCSTAVLSIK